MDVDVDLDGDGDGDVNGPGAWASRGRGPLTSRPNRAAAMRGSECRTVHVAVAVAVNDHVHVNVNVKRGRDQRESALWTFESITSCSFFAITR